MTTHPLALLGRGRRTGAGGRLRKRLRHRLGLRGDGGFTLIELMVASGVIATSLSLLAGVMTSGLTATGYARERQAANQLANQALEQIRALPFDTLKAGMSTTDLASDSDIASSGCGSTTCFGGEQIAASPSSNTAPLVPHRSTTAIGPTTYTISSYVTYYNNVVTTDARRVTVSVSWTSPLKGNVAKTVQAQTIVYSSPGGCQTTSSHPFPGPCQALLTGAAMQTAGSINITGTVDGVGLDHATLSTDRATSDGTIEQTSRVDGTAQASGATIQKAGDAEQPIGGSTISSHADNDNGSATPVYDTHSLTGPSVQSQTVVFGADSLATSILTAGDTGTTTSTTSACTNNCAAGTTPNPRNCPNITGLTNENDSLQCGGSVAQTGTTLNAVATLGAVGATTLASTTAQASGTTATYDFNSAPGTGKCLLTSGDGCVRTQVSRPALSTLSAGALPANLAGKPAGFTSFAQISGVNDTVTTEAGGGVAVPVATQTGGSITVWCSSVSGLLCTATGYVTKTFAQLAAMGAVATSTLAITDPVLGGGTTVSLSASVTPGSTATASTSTAATTKCPATCLTSASATSTPPVVTLTYSVTIGGVSHLNATIVLDPGAITAKATYAASPA